MGRIVNSIRLESVPDFLMGRRYTRQEQAAIVSEENGLLRCLHNGSVPIALAAKHMKLTKRAAGVFIHDDGTVWVREGDKIVRVDEDLSWIKDKPHTIPQKRVAAKEEEAAVDPFSHEHTMDWRIYYYNALEALRHGDSQKAFEWLQEYNDATDDQFTLDDLKADLQRGGIEEMRTELQRTGTPIPKTAQQQADVSTATGAGSRNISTPGDYDMPEDRSQGTGQQKQPHKTVVRRMVPRERPKLERATDLQR